MVPCEGIPPATEVGLRVIEFNAGVTVRSVVCTAPVELALNVTAVESATALVVTVNVVLELPAAIVTEVGTDATLALLLDSVTTTPPAGAAAPSDTVPTELT